MTSIPFDLPDIGLREISGTLSLNDEFLVFRVQDALVGEFDKEQSVIKIEPQALEDIRLDRGIIRDHIRVRPKKNDLLEAIPGDYVEELPLKIWNIYRRRAEALVEAVQRRQRQRPGWSHISSR